MILSANINFFNGEELLEKTVKNIRPLVEHLSLVYQKVSNWNEPISDEAIKVLNKLKDQNIIDDMVCYEPNFDFSPTENEYKKRLIGLELAIRAGASHFLLMDADEFYISEEFNNVKKIIEDENITYSCVKSYFYLHKSSYRSEEPDITNVCFIAKITSELFFEYESEFPIEMVDPTRRLVNASGNFKFFELDTISMHHMNFVRRDFNSKLINTSSAADKNFIKIVNKALNYWEWPKTFFFPNKPPYNIIKVEDRFILDDVCYIKKKKILLTNHFLRNFTGSEIATLDLAKEFISLGYLVTVGAFIISNPLKLEFDKLDICILNLNDLSSEHFDLIWAHHFTTLDSLLLDGSITADKIVFSSLSPYESLESPPLSVEKVNLLLANSNETKQTLVDMGIKDNSIYTFPNPIGNNFFDKEIIRPNKLNRIAVVSNHIPNEIKEAISILLNEQIKIKIYGMEGESQFITPQILEKFDAVITIGRTTQYCLALGIPVYCYDRFGGPGWINSSNIKKASSFNFSGRCTNQKISSESIAEDILTNFYSTILELDFYKEFAKKEYKLSFHIKNILEKVEKVDNVFYDDKLFKNISIRQRKYFAIKEISYNENKIDELNKYIIELNQDKENQRLKIDELNKYIIELNQDKENQRLKIDELNKYIIELNQEKENLKLKINELNNLKVVKLYRKMKSIIRKIIKPRAKSLISKNEINTLMTDKNIINIENPLFSIIIPIYDRTLELKDAVNSVLNQTFHNFEIILVCDGSPEKTRNIVAEFATHPQIRSFMFDDNSGNACRGRNKGIEISKGEYIVFLDSDDLCISDRLEKTYRLFLEQNADMISGSVEFLLDGSREIEGIKNGDIAYPSEYDFELLKKHNLMYTCTVAVKKSCLDKYGAFRREMIYREDHELWLRLGYRGCKIVCTRDVLSKYRVHSGNAELKFIEQDDKWYQLMLEKYDKEYK